MSHFRDLGRKGLRALVFAGGSEVQAGPQVEGTETVEKKPGLTSKSQEDGAGD